jgi:hypothetical protein
LLRSIAVVLIAVAAVSGGSASPVRQTDRHRSGGPVLASLDSLDEFRAAFNRDVGVARVVLLLSPT